MEGFIHIEKKKTKKKKNTKKISGCDSCGMYRKCKSGKMPFIGNGDKKILIIGDAVSAVEEEKGRAFSDLPSQYLRHELDEIGIDLDRDCWAVNAIQCHASKATPDMVSGCVRRLKKLIKELNPEKILLLGERAVDMFLQDRIQKSRISGGNPERFYGMVAPDQQYQCWVMADYHPSFVLNALAKKRRLMKKWGSFRENKGLLWEHPQLVKDDDFRIRSLYFKKYLKTVVHKKQFMNEAYLKHCEFIPDVETAIKTLKVLQKSPVLAMDYETTSLLPYKDDSEILCVSLSDGQVSYAFPFFIDNSRFVRLFKRLMTDPDIDVIIANRIFEDIWTRSKLSFEITNCTWDTMLAAHIIAPTVSQNTNLKVNAYTICGELGYDADVEDYIKGRIEKNPYSLNRLKELPIEKVGLYNAMDSLMTAKVYFHQQNIIEADRKLNSVFRIYMRGQEVFTDMSFEGFYVDEKQLIKNEIELEEKLTVIEYKLKNTEEVGVWNKKYPRKPFNFKSNTNLSELFFDILGYTTGKKTDSGQLSIDQSVLEEFSKKSALAELLCEYKKIFKLKNTDLKGLRYNTHEGRIHPFFGLSNASTGRSNSSRMNFQNLNVSDDYAVKMVRGCLKAHPGHEIVMWDYHALEVFGGLAHHGDPMMEAELFNSESVDAHTLMAQQVFGKDLDACARFCMGEKSGNSDGSDEEVEHFIKDELRKPCKNISFACAYGGSANRIFITLWDENLKQYHKKWFKHIGMGTPEKFKGHCKGIFEYYWNRYKVFGEWRKKIWEEYLSKGYIYNKFGFRLNGINSQTFITNAPIQGSSYIACLLANIKLSEVLKEKGYSSKIIAAIHDSLELSYDPKEMFEGDLYKDIKLTMEDYINKKVRWLTLPLTVDGEWFLDNWAEDVKEKDVRKRYGYEVEEVVED